MKLRNLAILLAIGIAQNSYAAQTIPLAAGNTAATSSDIVCTSSGAISEFNPSGPLPSVQLKVFRIANGTQVQIGALNNTAPAMNLTPYCPGTFEVQRPDVSSTGYTVGVTADLGGGATLGSVTQGTVPWVVDGSGVTQPVSAVSLPLPAGAATAANQTTANTSLSTIATNTTGASTAANQTTANTSLATIATNSGTQATAANQTAIQGTVGSTKFNRSELVSAQGYVAGGATYIYAANGYTAYTTPTDTVCVSETSANKHLIVDQFFLSVGATAATVETWNWVKRTTLDTGGSSTNPSMVSADSNQAATSAVVTLYTAAPTTGTSAGILAYNTVSATAVASAAPATASLQQVSLASNLTTYKSPYVLHQNESICANFNGAAWPSGGTASIHLQVVEVPTP